MLNIREMRKNTGMTQREFADRFDIPVGTLRRWEYGESTPAPYVLKMIANQLPVGNNAYRKICVDNEIFYFDINTNTIMDSKGTGITINVDINEVKEQNLALYVKDLFEAYYDAVQRFERDCELDKQEDIIWGD